MAMKEFDIKRGHFKNIEGASLRRLMEQSFEDVRETPEGLVGGWGALETITVLVRDKNTICVETRMRPESDENVANETIKRYNAFMEAATGFTAKERKKRAEKATGGDEQ